MSILYDAVKNIVMALIFITIIMNLMGNSSYKKYIGIFTGMLLILLIIHPITQLFRLDYKFESELIQNQFNMETEEFQLSLEGTEEMQQSFLMKKYKEKIQQQMEVLLEDYGLTLKEIEIQIEEDIQQSEYATIKGMQLTIEKKEETRGQKEEDSLIQKVEKIRIGDTKKEETNKTILSEVEELKLKKKLAKEYNVEASMIEIR